MADEWYTPPEIINRVEMALGGQISLDPTSCEAAQKVVQAERYWTKDDDALSKKSWPAKRLFMNPPYSNSGPFVKKAIQQWETNEIDRAVILLHVSTGSNWWRQLWRFPMAFFYDRICFLDEDLHRQTSPRHDHVAVFLPSMWLDVDHFEAVAHVTNRDRL